MVRLPLLLLLLSTTACAAAGSTNSGLTMGIGAGTKVAGDAFATADTVNAEVGAVWQALAPAYRQMELGGAPIDEGIRQFGVRRARLPRALAGAPLSRYLECGTSAVGGMPRADRNVVVADVTTELVALDSARTLLRTRVAATATEPGSTNGVRCGTTGAIEEALAGRVRVIVARM